MESSSAPSNPIINNLNSLLQDIHVRYIKLRDVSLHYKVFDVIFQDLHKKMKDVDPYYRKYSSTVLYAGSHFDRLRNLSMKKPNEFDMAVVIDLPLNLKENINNPSESDIILETKCAGLVQLKMGVQYQKLPERDPSEWPINKAAYEWQGKNNYLLSSKFISWFSSVVNKALNKYKDTIISVPVIKVDGISYKIFVSNSSPAITLQIRNDRRNFKMDVDLVPALKFPEERWPISKSFRPIPKRCKKGYWMIVPNKKPGVSENEKRGWLISLQSQERELMYNSQNLKLTIQLMKKLRDSLDMDKLASYYIKTIFFFEIMRLNDPNFWRNDLALLFTHMVTKLHATLSSGRIPYFWNKNNDLSKKLSRDTLIQYAHQLVPLIKILNDTSEYKHVAEYLLTDKEFDEYNAKHLHI